MHNGGIAEFHHMKRRLQKDLPDVAFDMVQGNTGMSSQCIHPSTRTQRPILRFGMGVRIVPVQGEPSLPWNLMGRKLTGG